MAKTAAKKKAKKKAKRRLPKTCSVCGGSRYGRGYKHKANCSEATGKGAAKGRRTRSAPSDGFDVADLDGLDVASLQKVRDHVRELLKAKAPEIKQQITDLQDTLKAIEK